MKRIPLPGGYETLIDTADMDLVAGFKWRVLQGSPSLFYVHAWHGGLHLYMHRLIIGAPEGTLVDHRNLDALDNRRANLRLTDNSGNLANSKGHKRVRGVTSEYCGVFWERSRNRWAASITVNRQQRRLGRFTSEVAAAHAYDRAAVEAWGEMARTNFPVEAVTL